MADDLNKSAEKGAQSGAQIASSILGGFFASMMNAWKSLIPSKPTRKKAESADLIESTNFTESQIENSQNQENQEIKKIETKIPKKEKIGLFNPLFGMRKNKLSLLTDEELEEDTKELKNDVREIMTDSYNREKLPRPRPKPPTKTH